MYTQPRDKFQESDIYIKNTKNIRGVIKKCKNIKFFKNISKNYHSDFEST